MKELNNMDEQTKTSPEELSAQPGASTTLLPNSKKPLALVAGIILILLVLVGGYLLFNQNRSNGKIASIKSFEDCKKAGYPVNQSDPEQCGAPGGKMFYGPKNITTSPQPAIKADETANWKTYQGKYYSFKYPDTWLDTGNGGDLNFETIISYSGEATRVGLSLQSSPGTSNSQCFATNLAKTDIVSSYDISIGGYPGKKFLVNTSSQEPFFATAYATLYQDRCYILEFEYLSKEERDKNIAKSDIILSSFKFSGQNQTLDTANWKTYTSSEEGLSFKYPPEYKLSAIYDEYTKSTPVTIKGPNNFGFSYSVTNNRTAFYPGYISHTREVNISGHKLYVSYVGRDSGKKVSYIELHENKYNSGFLGDILLDYASRKNQDKWVSFGGSYSSPEQETSENFDPNEFANKPEVKIAEKIISTLTYEK